MLLWIVRATVGEWTNPEPLVVLEEAPEVIKHDPTLPVLTTGSAIVDWLGANRLEAGAARNSLTGYRYWMRERGFPVTSAWYSIGEPKLVSLPGSLPDGDAELLALAGAGNANAAVTLGTRSLQSDPQIALEWFDQAIVNGSIWAMIRSAELLTTLGDPALREFQSSAVWQQAFEMISAEGPPLERALAWHIAAVIAGGYAILDSDLANRISGLATQLDAAQIDNACELAQEYVLDTAMARRARGGAVFSTERPQFALSVTEPATVLPCDVPVQPLVDMTDCLTETFVGPAQRLGQMYFCPST